MARKLRFGLVGCGRIGATADDRVRDWPIHEVWLPYSHAASIRATPDAELVAVCDSDSSAATATAKRYDVSADFRAPARCLHTRRSTLSQS